MFDVKGIAWKRTRYNGIYIHPIWHDSTTNDTAMFIRMDPNCAYPPHIHIDIEDVLVLQGGMRDGMGELKAGQFRRYYAEATHHPVALDGKEACILFALTRGGIELLEESETNIFPT